MTQNNAPDLVQAAAVDPKVFCFRGTSSEQQKSMGMLYTPDCNGAVNDQYFVEFINYVFAVYDKTSGELVGLRYSGYQFWSLAGIRDPRGIIDPRIVFIPDAGRHGQWLAVQLNMGNGVFIATTNPDNPDPQLYNWKASQFDLPGNDFTMLGYDLNGIYIGINTAGPDNVRVPQVVFIPRAKALAHPPQVGPDDITIIGPLIHGRPPWGTNLYPMIDRSGIGWPYGTAIGIDTFSKRHLTFSLVSPQFREIISHGLIEVEPFEPAPGGSKVRQPSINSIVQFGGSLTGAPTGDSFNIWVAHTVQKPGQCLGVRWYRLYIDPVTRMPGPAAWGEVFDPNANYDYFNPSIVSLGKDDYTVISLSRSGNSYTSTDPGSAACGNIGAYAAIVRETGSGQHTTKIVTLMSGQAPDYVPQESQVRWGDYSTICRDPDPKHPRRVWTINEFVLKGGQTESQWCNAIASIDLP